MEGEKKYKISLRGRMRGIRERMELELEKNRDRKYERKLNFTRGTIPRSFRNSALANEIMTLMNQGYNTQQVAKIKKMNLRTVNLIVMEKRKEADSL